MATNDSTSPPTVDTNRAQAFADTNVRAIRHALHIGLECFGEVERVTDRFEILSELLKQNIDPDLKPIHPTGTASTVGIFAEALRSLEHMAERDYS